MDKVIEIPTQSNNEIKNFLFAPLEPSLHKICIEGKLIPRMTGRLIDGKCEVHLDGRWCYIFDTIESAYTAAAMAANALAIGEGYSHLGAPNKEQPFAPTVMMLDDIPR